MNWPAMLFNLCIGLLFAVYLHRAVRRYERRADAIMAKLDREVELSIRKWEATRDEIRTSMRTQTDRAIAKMQVTIEKFRAMRDAETLQNLDTETPAQVVTHLKNIMGSVTLKETTTSRSRPVETVKPTLAGRVPTQTEIEILPRWAQVAFAARCARRVLGLLPQLWPDMPPNHVQVVEKSVAHAESIAATGQPDPGIKNVFKLGAVDAAHNIAAEAQSHHHIGAGAVASAAATAMYAAYTDAITQQTYSTAYNAEFASSKLEPPVLIATLIRHDFDHIVKLAKRQEWTEDTPIPPSVFGPLWPDGPPEDWPKPENPTFEIVFKFDVPDDQTTTEAVTFVKVLSAALCSLDLAGGGHGLEIQPPLEITIPALVPTGSLR